MAANEPQHKTLSADQVRHSNEKSNSRVRHKNLDDTEIQAALQNYVPDTLEEKRLVRRIDMILLPILWWMYILAYLDRGNIANANAAGMSADLGYSLLVTLFFISYVVFEVPSNMILMKVKPSIYMPTIVWVWGCIVVGMSQTKTSTGLLAGRFFLGAVEAGLSNTVALTTCADFAPRSQVPGALFVLTCWYTKREVGCIAPALGGIMAGAITSRLEGAHGMAGWRWLLLIEGVVTVACGWTLYFILPDWPHNSRILSPEQRLLAHVRILRDRNPTAEPEDSQLTPWQAFTAVLKDGRTFFFLIMYSANLLAGTMTYFLPTMVKGLGYTSVTAQWMTVPIWMCGAVFQLFWSYTSDKTQDRRWHNSGLLGLAGIAALVALLVQNDTVKYVMMCLIIGAIYTTIPLILNWTSEILARPERKRSVAIAFVNSLAHSAYCYGSFLWPSSEGPRNLKGFAASTAALLLSSMLAALLPVIFRYLPKQALDGVETDDEVVPSVDEKLAK
ncbi:MFS general substrate transporter [Polyplosphaeria fusca]|uniref:MFS general substrate transporter n=1 Tax=Polyplosphaeria fusca TaxID=682080 RepID=A0A9P4V2I1_9PLEO|nr:MFS general substrate transporter [Polyplosphaeria fusca]